MPIFDIRLPDGRTATIEAGDESSALRGAQEWHMANPMPSAAQDAARTVVPSLVRGAAIGAGLPGDVGELITRGSQWLAGTQPTARQPAPQTVTPGPGGGIVGATAAVPGTEPAVTANATRGLRAGFQVGPNGIPSIEIGLPTSTDIREAIEGVTGPLYRPQTTAGKYVNAIGEFALGAVLPGGAIRNVVAPAVGSEALGQAYEGTAAEPYARIVGALGGAVTPSLVRRAVTPLPVEAGRADAVAALRAEGVDALTAGQVTGRKRLMAMESELGGGRGADMMTRQSEQYTSAALRRIGEDAPRATPDVLERALTRIGNQFEKVAARNTVNVDRPLANSIADVQRDYNFAANPMQRQIIQGAIDDIISVVQSNNGVIPGAQYQAMRSRLGAAARESGDNQVRTAFYGIQRALDDAMERSIRAAGNQADVSALREARRQYRNFLVIERAVGAAGENAATGLISPAALKNATQSVQGRRNYVTGNGDFEGLARAGVAVMSPLPNSGTPIRTAAMNMGMSPVGAGLGAAVGNFISPGPLGTAFGGAVGGLAPSMVGRAMMTAPGRAYLGNNLMGAIDVPPLYQRALISSMLASQSPALPPPRQ